MNNRMESLAKDIYKWCKNRWLWEDCIIYFNGKAWSSSGTWGNTQGVCIDDELYEYIGKNPKDYFKYANPKTLSMSFEGPLYDVLNTYPHWAKQENEFRKLFKKYGLYYEYGDAWNLSAYELY